MNKIVLGILILVLTISFMGCGDVEHKLSDEDFVLYDKMVSPDGDKVLFHYKIQNKIFGQSKVYSTIIEAKDTLGVINKNGFLDNGNPDLVKIEPIKWINNDEVLALLDPRPFARMNIPIDSSSFVNGTTRINLKPKDITQGKLPFIEEFELSPNGKHLLVAYRYNNVEELEVSVIRKHGKLPKIGNIYSSLDIGNPVWFGNWKDNKTIELGVNINDPTISIHESAICESNYSVEIKEIDVQGAPATALVCWYNSPHYMLKQKKALFQDTVKVKGRITSIFHWQHEPFTSVKNLAYKYEYDNITYKSYLLRNKHHEPLEIGHEFDITINKNQPIIHKHQYEYIHGE